MQVSQYFLHSSSSSPVFPLIHPKKPNMLRVMQVRVLPTFEMVLRVGLPLFDVFFKSLSVHQKKRLNHSNKSCAFDCTCYISLKGCIRLLSRESPRSHEFMS